MLIRAAFTNLLSFNEVETVSFIAGKTQMHTDHVVPGGDRYEPNLLKSAIVYGANASGKSNLIKCFDTARRLILRGTGADEVIHRVPFKLCKDSETRPSAFEFEIKTVDGIFSYTASFTEHEIVEEKLTSIGKTTEKNMFVRTTKNGKVQVKSGNFLKKAEDRKFFEFIARGTRPNQLFLKETIERNSDWFRTVYDWFKDRLVIIYPNSLMDPIELLIRPNDRLKDNYHDFFEMLDLGIEGVEVREIDLEKEIADIPAKIMQDILRTIHRNKSITLFNTASGRYRFSRDEDGNVHGYRLVMQHRCSDGSDPVFFDVKEESDGTRRLIDLIPALIDLAESDRVFLIDEIDRSMHAQLSRAFMEFFFAHSSPESQILATTHELDLLDLELFRKDEIWFVEKDKASASRLYSLEEFKPRYDKDIRKGYLLGRFGAIPIVQNIEGVRWKQ